MSTRTQQDIGIHNVTSGTPDSTMFDGAALAEYLDWHRQDVRVIVYSARVHNVALEAFIAMVRAEWQAQSQP